MTRFLPPLLACTVAVGCASSTGQHPSRPAAPPTSSKNASENASPGETTPPPRTPPEPEPAALVVIGLAEPTQDVACTLQDSTELDVELPSGVVWRLNGENTIRVPMGAYEAVELEVDLGPATVRGKGARWLASPRSEAVGFGGGVLAKRGWHARAFVKTVGQADGVEFVLEPPPAPGGTGQPRSIDTPSFSLPTRPSIQFACEDLTARPSPPARPSRPRLFLMLGVGSAPVPLYADASGSDLAATLLAGRHIVRAGQKQGSRIEASVEVDGVVLEGWMEAAELPEWDPELLAEIVASASSSPAPPVLDPVVFGSTRPGGGTGSKMTTEAMGGLRPLRPSHTVRCDSSVPLFVHHKDKLWEVGAVKPSVSFRLTVAPNSYGLHELPQYAGFVLRSHDVAGCRPTSPEERQEEKDKL